MKRCEHLEQGGIPRIHECVRISTNIHLALSSRLFIPEVASPLISMPVTPFTHSCISPRSRLRKCAVETELACTGKSGGNVISLVEEVDMSTKSERAKNSEKSDM
jgi:hypothetical protein